MMKKQQINRALQAARTRNRTATNRLADEIDDGRNQCDTEKPVLSDFSDFPIRKQHTLLRVPFGVALVLSSADRSSAPDTPADEAANASAYRLWHPNRDPPDPALAAAASTAAIAASNAASVRGGQFQHADFVPRPAVGQRRGVPDRHRVEPRIALDQRRVAEPSSAVSRISREKSMPETSRSPGGAPMHRGVLLSADRRDNRTGRRMAAGGDLVGQRHSQEARREPEPRVKTDVLGGAASSRDRAS